MNQMDKMWRSENRLKIHATQKMRKNVLILRAQRVFALRTWFDSETFTQFWNLFIYGPYVSRRGEAMWFILQHIKCIKCGFTPHFIGMLLFTIYSCLVFPRLNLRIVQLIYAIENKMCDIFWRDCCSRAEIDAEQCFLLRSFFSLYIYVVFMFCSVCQL